MRTLHQALDDYVATVRALGTELRWPAPALRKFIDFLESEGAEWITTELAIRWATQPVGVQPATWAGRLSIVRGFARWLHQTDPRTEIPAQRLLSARHRRKSPHIFTTGQICDIMDQAARLRSRSGLRALTYKTLIGLLAASGLRPGEALALDCADVNLHDSVLILRKTKSGKSRFVPIETSACSALARYAAQRDQLQADRETQAFLVAENGTRLGALAVRRTFAKLCRLIEIRTAQLVHQSTRGPRLYDLRHTFATRKLVEWYATGLDVGRMIPVLSTYLGHSQAHFTYWYIEAVPELLRLAADRQTAHKEGGVR